RSFSRFRRAIARRIAIVRSSSVALDHSWGVIIIPTSYPASIPKSPALPSASCSAAGSVVAGALFRLWRSRRPRPAHAHVPRFVCDVIFALGVQVLRPHRIVLKHRNGADEVAARREHVEHRLVVLPLETSAHL